MRGCGDESASYVLVPVTLALLWHWLRMVGDGHIARYILKTTYAGAQGQKLAIGNLTRDTNDGEFLHNKTPLWEL